jgi:hypothetical protein
MINLDIENAGTVTGLRPESFWVSVMRACSLFLSTIAFNTVLEYFNQRLTYKNAFEEVNMVMLWTLMTAVLWARTYQNKDEFPSDNRNYIACTVISFVVVCWLCIPILLRAGN